VLNSSLTMLKSKSLANFSSFSFKMIDTEDESPASSASTSGSESYSEEDKHDHDGNDNLQDKDDCREWGGSESYSEEDKHNRDENDNLQDKDDCQEWAAGILADVDRDSSFRPRSLSENSFESLSTNASSSPEFGSSSHGFWRVRPGDTDMVEDFLSLSSSPNDNPILSDDGDDDDKKVIHTKSNVTFVDISPKSYPSDHYNEVRGDDSQIQAPQRRFTLVSSNSRNGLVRSHSYSAFSFEKLGSSPLTSVKPSLRNRRNSTDSDNFRLYFHKFVDLLIERDVIASGRRKGITSAVEN